ncbi:MAG TPA: FtsW/RodA/SpoVE family cell cycle protein [Candidatus Paceibacterota bacterium]|nr:FtsW/RodA/SpoVE family cell cycle protein [Candidatus Paceibacterota bacterium]
MKDFSAPRIDWTLLVPALVLSLLGILTMSTFGTGSSLAPRQLLFLALGVVAYLVLSTLDVRFIRRTSIIMTLYVLALLLLCLVLAVHPVMGAKSWFNLGLVSFQPADFAKFALLALLAKYLSRRHIEIGDFRHILVSGAYAASIILLILIQPDLGTAIILGSVWLSLMLVSGISKKHLGAIGLIMLIVAAGLWFEGLKPYQRTRILAFVNPASDIRGAGYNAYQAKIAVGSGELFGKGIGYGTQSKLRFLPEYQTDFIFAAFAEEWGFAGVCIALMLYGVIFLRIAEIARRSATNFDAFFTIGVLVLLAAHVVVHVGINLGLLPVTGTTVPFMSSGGSHLLLEFGLLGIVASLARQGRPASREATQNEYLGG